MTNDILLGGMGFYANHEELAGVVCVKCIQMTERNAKPDHMMKILAATRAAER